MKTLIRAVIYLLEMRVEDMHANYVASDVINNVQEMIRVLEEEL